MAFLADSGVPSASPRLVLPFERIEGLAILAFALVMASITLVQGSIAERERAAFSDTAVCEQRSLAAPNLFFLALH